MAAKVLRNSKWSDKLQSITSVVNGTFLATAGWHLNCSFLLKCLKEHCYLNVTWWIPLLWYCVKDCSNRQQVGPRKVCSASRKPIHTAGFQWQHSEWDTKEGLPLVWFSSGTTSLMQTSVFCRINLTCVHWFSLCPCVKWKMHAARTFALPVSRRELWNKLKCRLCSSSQDQKHGQRFNSAF